MRASNPTLEGSSSTIRIAASTLGGWPIDVARGAASCFSGATILGDGVPALILEAASLL